MTAWWQRASTRCDQIELGMRPRARGWRTLKHLSHMIGYTRPAGVVLLLVLVGHSLAGCAASGTGAALERTPVPCGVNCGSLMGPTATIHLTLFRKVDGNWRQTSTIQPSEQIRSLATLDGHNWPA
jgi:hypothetical protein